MLTQIAFTALAALVPITIQTPVKPALDNPAATSAPLFQGGVFEAQIAAGFEVAETGSGQVHFFEVRRVGDGRDLVFPALKLLCAPGAAASLTATEFANFLASNVRDYAASISMNVVSSAELDFVIDGGPRAGHRFQLSPQSLATGASIDIDVLAYQSGENLIGMVAKAEQADTTGLRAMAELVRSTLKVKPVTIASARSVQVGNFTVEVPVISPTAWRRPEGATYLRIGVGTGNFELGAQQVLTEGQAETIGANYLAARSTAISDLLDETGGTILDTRWAGEWIQNGQLRGFHTDFVEGDGVAFTISSFYLRAGTNFFTATVTVPTAELPGALPRLRDMLESLQCAGSEDALRTFFGRTSLNQAHGLTLYYPDTLRLEQELGDVVRLTLRGEDSLVPSDLAMHLFVAPGPLPGGGFEAFVRAAIDTQFPGAEVGEARPIEGDLLGQRQQGAQMTWRQGGKSFQATALSAPLHGGHLVALATSRLENANSTSWAFANILAGLQSLNPGDRSIQSDTFDVVFDPAEWTVNSSHVGTGSQFRFARVDLDLEVNFQDAASPLGATSQSSFDALVGASDPYFSIQETWAGTGVTGELNQEFEIQSERRDAINIDGVTCIRKRLEFALPDGEPYVLLLYYLLTEQRAVVAHFWATAADANALEAGQDLVETLRLRGGLGISEQVQILGDLRMELPLGFVRDTPKQDGPESLYFWNSLVEGSYAAVARIPSAGLPEYQELWQGVEASVQAGVDPTRLEEVATEVGELSFLGQGREARIYQYMPVDSEEEQLHLKSIAQAGPWTYELTVVGPLSLRYEFDKLQAVLEAATRVPTWLQVSEAGYNIAYDPAEYTLKREELAEGVIDGFVFSGEGSDEVFSINEQGAWTYRDALGLENLDGIRRSLTSQFDIGARKSFELKAGTATLQCLLSTNTQAKPIDGGMSFSN
ncbi:MAG: hypothetical protein ACI9D0_000636, partial [Bacteroidia bacterium]